MCIYFVFPKLKHQKSQFKLQLKLSNRKLKINSACFTVSWTKHSVSDQLNWSLFSSFNYYLPQLGHPLS